MAMKKKWRKVRYKGTAAVEAAIVFPLLLLLTLGILEYGLLFLKIHQTTNVARHGARLAVRPDSDNTEVLEAIDDLMSESGMADTGYTVELLPGDITSAETGDGINVQITVPVENLALINVPLLPLPSVIRARVTMAREGP